MSTIDEKILGKIKKCLALSQSAEPHEAAAALRQAQKLMEIHGVSQLDLGRSDVGSTIVKSKVSVSRIRDWELRLVKTVIEAFGCQLLWSKSNSYRSDVFGQFVIIGLKSQLELAQYTCEVMQRKLVKARGQFVTSLPDHFDRQLKTREADGFCHGWVEEISKTVHKFALSDETTSLVNLVKDEMATGEKVNASQRQVGLEGLMAGRQAASGESIHRPMGTSSHLQLGM